MYQTCLQIICMCSPLSSSLVNNTRKLFQINIRLHYYFPTFYYFAFYPDDWCYVFTTATHYKVCIMRWHCSGLVTDSIPRDRSHICGEALNCTVQFALVCGNGQWIGSAVSNAIVRSWPRSTASGSCLLSNLFYFSNIIEVVDNWPHKQWY